jgi:signal transduction histidine kinase/DNA-binding response OmpR family regulator
MTSSTDSAAGHPPAAEEKAKILVVDDLAENLLVYRTLLEELGQEVIVAHSGEEALKEVLRHDFAVILLDVNMPGLTGLETAAVIRTRKKSAHTPIIFLTAYTDELRVNEGYAHGAVDFIATPVVPAILRAKIKVFVDLFRLNQEIKRHAEERVAHAEERSRREAAEDANRRLSFLARAGAVIAKSLDRETTIESIVRLVVPEHADQAVLAEFDSAGHWHGAWAARFEPSKALTGTDGLSRLPAVWRQLINKAVTAGQAEVPCQATDNNHPDGLYLLAVPLRDRDRVFAVLLIARGSVYGQYSPADVAMMESVAWRSAIALVNARLYGEIDHANQQKNRFLSMLAHELRNPLAPIRSAVDVMRLCQRNPDDIDWARDVIDRQVNHLIRLVDDLLDISRITLGKIRLQIDTVDAAALVNAAVEISKPLIEKGEHQLSLVLPETPLMLRADQARLTQVLANLLNNAAKYTPAKGSITIAVERTGHNVMFRVTDTGVGIPSAMLDKVFEIFTQIDNSLDRAQGGLGIGLTLVRELVNMHGGKIFVTSEGQGRGSEFTVLIPCLTTETPPDPDSQRLEHDAPLLQDSYS